MVDLPELPSPKYGYVIYNPRLDKYSRGGSYPSWSKKAKIWTSIGALKSHLAMFIQTNYRSHKGERLLCATFEVGRSDPYLKDECRIFEIVNKVDLGLVADTYATMIINRDLEEKKKQKRRIDQMIEEIRVMNEINWSFENGPDKNNS